ncbi:MAG: hypothetical protein A3A13_03225 [Candidatus Yanofskybacteria bacterium RIFCSPLOWO2_01_FULL_43_22]|uniref:Uncharacterized protein n=1 Tax=Candidatus Yanofskybacteria bacterium RIFCSPLOWO2_01_FULL_43_22 TaxID=1802695 RepID=A0A1F8GE16_9BACT|nr:MAG: hypothetical protein A3A13_03225 [Candidatus Yanofskybacteria bacterium RIFCSPLOWO2_01_FULL_43_22]
MKIKRDLQIRAVALRKSGHSLSEISDQLNVAKSSASLWVRNVKLSDKALQRILICKQKGVQKGGDARKMESRLAKNKIYKEAEAEIADLKTSKGINRLVLVMIYWCEGGKDDSSVSFTNSDPDLTRSFLDLLEKSFGADRRKIGARLHLHEYHDPKIQLAWWSKKLALNEDQFKKFYLKPNTGKRKRDNYPGCVNIRYYNSFLARKLLYLAMVYLNKNGGIS